MMGLLPSDFMTAVMFDTLWFLRCMLKRFRLGLLFLTVGNSGMNQPPLDPNGVKVCTCTVCGVGMSQLTCSRMH